MSELKLSKTPKYKEIESMSEDDEKTLQQKGWRRVQKGTNIYRKKLEPWEFFEMKIRVRLEDFGFQDVDGGSNFKLDDNQIDAFGGFDRNCLVIECKSKKEPGKKNLRNVIENYAGRQKKIKKAIKKNYGHYEKVIFLIWLDETVSRISKKNAELAKQNNIIIKDYQYLVTYEKMYPILGKSTKFDILRDLNAKPIYLRKQLKVPAIKYLFKKYHFYNFLLDAEQALKISYVYRTETKEDQAYQRILKPKKIDNIRKFVNNEGYFPNNVILAFDQKLNFKKDKTLKIEYSDVQIGEIQIPKIYRCARIIDGQHRVFGFSNVEPEHKNRKLFITAIENINRNEQAELFMDINDTQTKIKPNLLWDLMGQTRPESHKGAISNIVKELNKKDPFQGYISIPSINTSGHIGIANFSQSIYDTRLFDKDTRYGFYVEKGSTDYNISNSKMAAKFIRKLFKTISENKQLKDNWNMKDDKKKGFLFTNNGLNVILKVVKRYIDNNNKDMKKISTKDIDNIFCSALAIWLPKQARTIKNRREQTSSESGRATVAKEIYNKIDKKYIR